MNRTEKNILQGLYQHEARPGHWKTYPYEAIRWLDGKNHLEVRGWISADGRFKTWNPAVAYTQGERQDLVSRIVIMRWLKYLSGKGYIEIAGEQDMDLRLSLTTAGVDVARLCTSRFGRAELWYQQHQSGLIGLGMTIVVAFITSTITTCTAS